MTVRGRLMHLRKSAGKYWPGLTALLLLQIGCGGSDTGPHPAETRDPVGSGGSGAISSGGASGSFGTSGNAGSGAISSGGASGSSGTSGKSGAAGNSSNGATG